MPNKPALRLIQGGLSLRPAEPQPPPAVEPELRRRHAEAAARWLRAPGAARAEPRQLRLL